MVSSRTEVTFYSYEHPGTGRLNDVYWWFTTAYKSFWSKIQQNNGDYIISVIKICIFYSKENIIKCSSTFPGKKKKRYKDIGTKVGKYYSTQNSTHTSLLKSYSCVKQVQKCQNIKWLFPESSSFLAP